MQLKVGVLGGAGRQDGKGRDRRCCTEAAAPVDVVGRGGGVRVQPLHCGPVGVRGADAALAPQNLSPFPGDGAGPRSSSRDAHPAPNQETR